MAENWSFNPHMAGIYANSHDASYYGAPGPQSAPASNFNPDYSSPPHAPAHTAPPGDQFGYQQSPRFGTYRYQGGYHTSVQQNSSGYDASAAGQPSGYRQSNPSGQPGYGQLATTAQNQGAQFSHSTYGLGGWAAAAPAGGYPRSVHGANGDSFSFHQSPAHPHDRGSEVGRPRHGRDESTAHERNSSSSTSTYPSVAQPANASGLSRPRQNSEQSHRRRGGGHPERHSSFRESGRPQVRVDQHGRRLSTRQPARATINGQNEETDILTGIEGLSLQSQVNAGSAVQLHGLHGRMNGSHGQMNGLHRAPNDRSWENQRGPSHTAPVPNLISRTEGDVEQLDPRYRIQENPKTFFKVGRVFAILWPEPAGHQGTVLSENVTIGRYSQNIYSSIRRMVVFQEKQGWAWCLPITTYSGQGVGKPGVDVQRHAIVYMTGAPSEPPPDEPRMVKAPIAVDPFRADRKLDRMSRLNFGKIYTVEWYVKVMQVGKIAESSMPSFRQYVQDELSTS